MNTNTGGEQIRSSETTVGKMNPRSKSFSTKVANRAQPVIRGSIIFATEAVMMKSTSPHTMT